MIYLTGDTHGERSRIVYMEHKYCLSEQDILIVCGDFGYVWKGDDDENAFLDGLEDRPYTICFVDGNHENFALLNSLPVEQWHGGKIHRVRRNVIHLMRGQVFDLEGKRFFTMGGAYSVDRYLRKLNVSWWEEEIPTEEELQEARDNLTRCGWQVDYVLTHTAPRSVIWQLSYLMHFHPDDHDAELTWFFEDLKYDLQFKHWYFGHFHEDRELPHHFTLLFMDVVSIE